MAAAVVTLMACSEVSGNIVLDTCPPQSVMEAQPQNYLTPWDAHQSLRIRIQLCYNIFRTGWSWLIFLGVISKETSGPSKALLSSERAGVSWCWIANPLYMRTGTRRKNTLQITQVLQLRFQATSGCLTDIHLHKLPLLQRAWHIPLFTRTARLHGKVPFQPSHDDSPKQNKTKHMETLARG